MLRIVRIILLILLSGCASTEELTDTDKEYLNQPLPETEHLRIRECAEIGYNNRILYLISKTKAETPYNYHEHNVRIMRAMKLKCTGAEINSSLPLRE